MTKNTSDIEMALKWHSNYQRLYLFLPQQSTSQVCYNYNVYGKNNWNVYGKNNWNVYGKNNWNVYDTI